MSKHSYLLSILVPTRNKRDNEIETARYLLFITNKRAGKPCLFI